MSTVADDFVRCLRRDIENNKGWLRNRIAREREIKENAHIFPDLSEFDIESVYADTYDATICIFWNINLCDEIAQKLTDLGWKMKIDKPWTSMGRYLQDFEFSHKNIPGYNFNIRMIALPDDKKDEGQKCRLVVKAWEPRDPKPVYELVCDENEMATEKIEE
jgi:hypothetical protein